MEKKNIMIEAIKFLPTDMLYGTIAGVKVKDYLTNNADRIISDDWSPDEVASRIKEAMYKKNTDEPLFKPACESVELPLWGVLDVTESDKREYIEECIKLLPYSGDIRNTPNTTINIAEILRSKIKLMNDDYSITYGFDGQTRSLLDEYRVLLSNEFLPPSKMDKLEVLAEGIRRLREAHQDYDEVTKVTISGKTFYDAIKDLPSKMDDSFMINNGFDNELATDVLYRRFQMFAEARYNSFNSKPGNVETIKVNRNENNELEATSEYIFLNDNEIQSTVKSHHQDADRLRSELLDIIVGIDEAKTVDTLEVYDGLMTDTWKKIKEENMDDEYHKALYEKAYEEINSKTKEVVMMEDNVDNAETLFRYQLDSLREKMEALAKDFTHIYEAPSSDERQQIRSELVQLRKSVEESNISMNHEIEDAFHRLNVIETMINYSIDNINHLNMRKKEEIEELITQLNAKLRVLDYESDIRRKAALHVNIEDLTGKVSRMLDDYHREGYIDSDEHHEYRTRVNKKLEIYGFDGIKGGTNYGF